MDTIMKLSSLSNRAYIQENKFLYQGFDLSKIFVFKMSKVELDNGIDLVRRMQLSSDLKDVWLMFNHMKHMK